MALAQNRDKPVGWSVKFINLFDKFLLLIQTFGRISFRMYSRHSTTPGVPYRSGLVWGYSSRCGPDKGTRVKLISIYIGNSECDIGAYIVLFHIFSCDDQKPYMIRPRVVYADEMSLFTDSTIYKRMAFVLAILGLALEFVSFVSPFWISKTFDNGTAINVGLWLTCVDLDCTGISSSPGRLTAKNRCQVGKPFSYFIYTLY